MYGEASFGETGFGQSAGAVVPITGVSGSLNVTDTQDLFLFSSFTPADAPGTALVLPPQIVYVVELELGQF